MEWPGSILLSIAADQDTDEERELSSRLSAREPVHSVVHPLNQLLQAMPAAEFAALRPHLEIVDLVREAVLIEAGVPLTHIYLPCSGVISMRVRLSRGQTLDVAMVGCGGVVGASAGFGGMASLTDAVVLLPGKASILHVAHVLAAAGRNHSL